MNVYRRKIRKCATNQGQPQRQRKKQAWETVEVELYSLK